MKQKLSFLTLLMLFTTVGFAQVTATQPPDIMQCGWEVFDLTQQDNIILGEYDPENYTVTYFETEADAEANTNTILNTQQYVSNGQSQTIYARLSSLTDDSFDVVSFEISWTSWQDIPINDPTPLEACYEEGDEFVTVDLTSKNDEILAGATGFVLSYYFNGSDAELGINAIANPEAFEWPVDFEYEYVYVRVENPVTGCYNMTTLYVEIVQCTDNIISGTLTFDNGDNGCDDGTPGAYIMLSLTHDNDVFYTYTDAQGNYTFNNVPDGVNFVNVMGQGIQTFQTVPASYTLTTPGIIDNNDFCLTTPEPYSDVAVYFMPYQQPRPGFPFQGTLVIQNWGNTTLSGDVSLQFDDAILTYDSSSPAMAVSGNMLTVSYTNLQPLTPQYIYVDFTVFTPPTVNAGDILELVANVTANEGDDDLTNNEDVNELTVVNSWDPNDITCREGDYITEEQADGYLHYLIRFQNEGTAEAVNIRVEHELDSKFDVSTLQPIAASHDYRVEIENNTVNFIFDNINLTWADENEPESHGFINFRIKPNSNVQLGDTFEATAGIYFDFNEAIITNTATTTIQNTMGVAENMTDSFVIYPNPASGTVNLLFTESTTDTVNVTVTDLSGKTVVSKKVSTNGDAMLDVSSLSSGMYFINVKADEKQQTKKLMIK